MGTATRRRGVESRSAAKAASTATDCTLPANGAGARRPELIDVYASAKDPATAARLWDLTEQALGRPLPV